MCEDKGIWHRLQSGQSTFEKATVRPLEVRYLLRKVKDCLNTPSHLDACWLVGMAVGRDVPVFGHENIKLTISQATYLDHLIILRNKAVRSVGCVASVNFILCFYLNDHTLDPRPDSECLIDAAVDYVEARLLRH